MVKEHIDISSGLINKVSITLEKKRDPACVSQLWGRVTQIRDIAERKPIR